MQVFREVERLIQLPQNDFSWAGWENSADALAEIRQTSDRVRQNEMPFGGDVLFAPTGPLQEVSLSSGWGHEFCAIADEFDLAMSAPDDCLCHLDPFSYLEQQTRIGMDAFYADVFEAACRRCGQVWLRYQFEMESESRSGRWFLGAVEGEVTVSGAKAQLEDLAEYWCGGSYFDGQVALTSGPINLS